MILTLSKRHIFFTLSALMFCAVLLMPFFTQAQTSLSLSVTPTLFEMSANPGQVWQSSVKVINSNPFDMTVYASVVNFAPQGESGQGKLIPVFEEMTEGSTLAEWIEIDSKPLTIEREQSFSIPFTVLVPEDASPGGHFAAILVSTQPPEPEPGALNVRTAQIVTSLFFVRVAGDINEAGAIRSFTTTQKFAEKPEATFELRFENKGNVHLQPRGEIKIFNMWGKERGVIPINTKTHFGNVLPESIRKFSFSWKGEQSIADIGRYKAEASLAYGTAGTKFATSDAYFWVLPIKSMLITVGSIVGLLLLVSWVIKLYVRRMLQMAGVNPVQSTRIPTDDEKYEAKENDVRIGSYNTISAPMRSGYSDLKKRLEGVRAFVDVVKVFCSFAVAYKKFFAGLFIIIITAVAAYYFLSDVTDSEKSFDVTISNPDSELNLSSEEITFEESAKNEGLPLLGDIGEQQFELFVTNTSGEAGTAARRAIELSKSGYAISGLPPADGRIEKKTVIIYDTDVQEIALTLSKRLGGALLSARTASSTGQLPNITVFVGADQIQTQ